MNKKINPATPIPQFALYGETDISHNPEFAHIEDIRARSLRNGWLIKPHRHTHLSQIICVSNGAADVRLDATNTKQSGCWITTIPPGVVHGFKFRPGTRGVVLSLAVGMPGLDAENQIGHLLDNTLAQAHVFSCEKNSPLFVDLCLYLELIKRELASPFEKQDLALFSLIKLVLITVSRQIRQAHLDNAAPGNTIQLATRYRTLQEQHYKEHWTIGDYAKMLNVSISTLNRACQEALGSSAKRLIQERLHIEAKRRLIYTQETLEQISRDLGFKDAAYFSRAFKQLEGKAPKSYRTSASPGTK
ncbi:MAG: helix-turn-helix domain-containing protein [Pseudomonadota bacterium]